MATGTGIWAAGLAGLAVALAVWWVLGPWRRTHRRPAGLTGLLRWLWPWVAACAGPCGRLLPWRLRQRWSERLQQAGLGRGWQPGHVASLQVLSVTVALLFATGLRLPASWVEVGGVLLAGLPAAGAPLYWLHQRSRDRQRRMQRELPFLLDLMTLGVEGGLNLHGALAQAVSHAPPGPLCVALRHALAAMRTGAPRRDALVSLAAHTRLPAVREWVDSMLQAEDMGMSLAPVLRAQSAHQRDVRFLLAEQRAQEAPVRLLAPLALCIFPCTFLVIGFPIAMQLGLGA